ncbi:hypothetical protein CANARDRAFT_194938, partial [[Candida] arabinofermentans NRRL YB-2248]
MTLSQYTAVFKALSVRGATDQITDLWDTFLKREFLPNDLILCYIIQSYIASKSYADALGWFAAFSHYNIPLNSMSYGLMLTALSGSNDIRLCFGLLDELDGLGNIKLEKKDLNQFLGRIALLGDYKSIELIISKYYTSFGIERTIEDMTWILKAHYHANRHGTVVHLVEKFVEEGTDTYELNRLALESSVKFNNLSCFKVTWRRLIERFPDQMEIRTFIPFMVAQVRQGQFSSIPERLDQIQKRFGKLPSIIFNQMIYEAIRLKQTRTAMKILGESLKRGVQPSPKTYSLMMKASLRDTGKVNDNLEITTQLLDDVLVKRKEDGFGKLDHDIHAASFKQVIANILKHEQVSQARKYFELYIQHSKDNLLDNIHILSAELMVLGAEQRWNEFEQCFARYVDLIRAKMDVARMKSTHEPKRKVSQVRFDTSLPPPSSQFLDEPNIKYNIKPNSKTPAYLNGALHSVWPYRLQQLSETDRLDEVMTMVQQLRDDGLVLSHSNYNTTALVLSRDPSQLRASIQFMDKYMLPGILAAATTKMAHLRLK